VVERLQQLDDILAREERNRAFGQCLDLEDLRVAAPGIDVINVTDKIPWTSELHQDAGSIGPRTVNLDQAGEDPEHHVGRRTLQKDDGALVVVDHGVMAGDFIDELARNAKIAKPHLQPACCIGSSLRRVHRAHVSYKFENPAASYGF
jgi:hypothetical protein